MSRMKEQKGQILALALVLLALSTMLLVPFLKYTSTGVISTRVSKQLTAQEYAADAGIEDAIWRLQNNIDGLADSLSLDNPSTSYSIVINDINVSLVAGLPQPPETEPAPQLEQGLHLRVAKDGQPYWAKPLVSTTFTYTIIMTNYGTSNLHVAEIRDHLPQGFEFVLGSTSGVTITNPTVTYEGGQQHLSWILDPRPRINSGQVKTLVFQATATPEAGIYQNQAWVRAPQGVGLDEIIFTSGPAAPISAGIHEIRARSGQAKVQARIAVSSTIVSILSWGIE